MATPFRIHGPIVSPASENRVEWHSQGAMVVDEHGKILWRDDEALLPENFSPIQKICTSDIIMPGFVDAHVHLPQHDYRGRFGTSLLDWLDHFIYPAEQRFADDTVARESSRCFFRALRQVGTCTAMVFASVHESSTHIAFEQARESGLRVLMGKTLMDRGAPLPLLEQAPEALTAMERLIERWHKATDKLSYVVTPRFAPACSESLLRIASTVAERHDTHIQTHINESPNEVRLVSSLFPNASSYSDVYRNTGILTPRTILGHNIHTDDSQLTLLKRYGCSIAHCPDSNLFLGSGRFPLEAHQRTGLRLCLGSDVGAGTTLSMFSIMRSMTHAQGRALHPFLPLYYATRGGAVALGLDHEFGSLDPGKYADFITVAVDLDPRSLPAMSAEDVASLLVYRTPEERVRRLWVGGEEIPPDPYDK